MPKPTLYIYTYYSINSNGHWLLLYYAEDSEFARFEQAADKTSAQRLSYMSAVPPIACDEAKHGATMLQKKIYMKALFPEKNLAKRCKTLSKLIAKKCINYFVNYAKRCNFALKIIAKRCKHNA